MQFLMKKIFLFLIFAAALYSCSSDSSDAPADQYDRTAILQNWADNIIIPSYENYSQKLAGLKIATADFTTTTDEAKLGNLRSKWLEAYMAYQYVGVFNIGKAEELQFNKYCNTYPANSTLIDSKIANADISMEGPANDIAQGFPALDYLLYGLGDTPGAVVSLYSNEANGSNYKNYLTAVVDRLISLNTVVLADWTGGYKNTFISRADNTSSGSLNRMVNAYVQYYEKDVRTGKVGIPAGRFSTTPLPEKVEGYYSKVYSKQLLLEGVKACRDFFNGKHFGSATTGASLASYLEFLNVTGMGNDATMPLKTLMDNQFATAQSAINTMQDDLHQQIQTDNAKMLQSFDALQRNVAYMKTDMVSAMSISIDYADTDGD